jgi:hypothetical protein
MPENDLVNKNVLSLERQTARLRPEVMSHGELFRIIASGTEKTAVQWRRHESAEEQVGIVGITKVNQTGNSSEPREVRWRKDRVISEYSSVQTPYGTARYRTADSHAVTHMKIYANSGFNVCKLLVKMAVGDSDVVIAAAAYYYLEDEHNTKKRVRRPRGFWIHDVKSRIGKVLNHALK